MIANQAAARNRVILWELFETGIHVTEVCRLRLGDVDREQGMVRVQGKGEAVRWLTLGHKGQRSLLDYLDHYRLKEAMYCKQGNANAEPFFLSKTGHPLTKGAIGLLFGRIREWVGGSPKTICASLLRKNFAVRYLQTGGDQSTLRELLGQQKSVTIKCSVGRNDEMMDPQKTEGKSRLFKVMSSRLQASSACF